MLVLEFHKMFKSVFVVFWTLVLLMRCIAIVLMVYSPISMSLGTCMQWGEKEVLAAVFWTRRSLTVPILTLNLTWALLVLVELFRRIPSIHYTLKGPTFLGVYIHPLVIWKLQEVRCRKCTNHIHTPMPMVTAGTEEGDSSEQHHQRLTVNGAQRALTIKWTISLISYGKKAHFSLRCSFSSFQRSFLYHLAWAIFLYNITQMCLIGLQA